MYFSDNISVVWLRKKMPRGRYSVRNLSGQRYEHFLCEKRK